jgi:hypothetical protein
MNSYIIDKDIKQGIASAACRILKRLVWHKTAEIRIKKLYYGIDQVLHIRLFVQYKGN